MSIINKKAQRWRTEGFQEPIKMVVREGCHRGGLIVTQEQSFVVVVT